MVRLGEEGPEDDTKEGGPDQPIPGGKGVGLMLTLALCHRGGPVLLVLSELLYSWAQDY